ncbi:MAG TPA: PEP-CTERM sorting domain-containing protein [Dongiaceae bacterium]|nr:PEP-CTERM sorting domain-containing protein [Dongiaceae bacterium]
MASRWYRSLRLSGCAAALGLLACLLPVASHAQCNTQLAVLCVGNNGGQGTYSTAAGFHMDGSNGSIASTVTQVGSLLGANGTLSLSTGAFSGSSGLSGSGTFGDGTLTISNVTYNSIFYSTFFTGSLTNIQWIALGKAGGFFQYELVGALSGTLEGTTPVMGETAQLYFHSKTAWNGTGAIQLANGSTGLVVPEPASMGMMGTALLGMAFLVRKRIKS